MKPIDYDSRDYRVASPLIQWGLTLGVGVLLVGGVGKAILLGASLAQFTPAPECVAAFKSTGDSAAKTFLASTRLTAYQRRALTRIDSLAQAFCPGPVETVEVGIGPMTRTYYASGMWGKPLPGVDTVTVCAVVHYPDHSERLGWPVIRTRAIGLDSVAVGIRGGNPLRNMCQWSLGFAGLWLSFDSVNVDWAIERFPITTPNGTVNKWIPTATLRR